MCQCTIETVMRFSLEKRVEEEEEEVEKRVEEEEEEMERR